MEFQKERVFTALNADELKVGSKVIVADSMEILKDHVNYHDRICVLDNIESEDYTNRFFANNARWNLAYLVSELEEKKLKWTDLKIGDVIQNEKHTHSMMVIGIDHREEAKSHIYDGVCWLDNDDLEYWEKVE